MLENENLFLSIHLFFILDLSVQKDNPVDPWDFLSYRESEKAALDQISPVLDQVSSRGPLQPKLFYKSMIL